MRRTWPGSTPKLIMTAMSRVFSITIMVSAMRMLSAATMTMRAMMMKVTICSSLRALNRGPILFHPICGHEAFAGCLLDGLGDLGRAIEIVDLKADDGDQVRLV